MTRNLKDEFYIVNTVLPDTGATVQTEPLDLEYDECTVNSEQPESVNLEVCIPELTTAELTDGETITVSLEDSADGVTYDPVTYLADLVSTGAGGAGAAKASLQIKLLNLRRYVRANVTASAGVPAQTKEAVLQLLF